jgi:signal transduction histidine kinase
MQREFINIAAHELRTPIQPILGASELMKFEFEKGGSEKVEVTKEDIEIIIRNASRLERLSSDILELARIGSGGQIKSAQITVQYWRDNVKSYD